jgi:hypothetical protein
VIIWVKVGHKKHDYMRYVTCRGSNLLHFFDEGSSESGQKVPFILVKNQTYGGLIEGVVTKSADLWQKVSSFRSKVVEVGGFVDYEGL